ncbi:MAG: patatin-like phospholipase family protein [Lysobacterales bacterium]
MSTDAQSTPLFSSKEMRIPVFRNKLAAVVSLFFLLTGCANYGTPKNIEIPDPRVADSYSLHDWQEGRSDSDITFILTFSGGGTRASALSYGVMQALRDTNINYKGHATRLLDEIDYISSVSGGSFTSAYYGLHGDDIFKNFENDFLRFDLEKHLALRTFDPFLLFSKEGRTESAIKYYEKYLFHGATFADMIREDRPMIIINSSDLAYGIRFSFIQEYFDLLCSELSAYPVADAVAASSAVPVLFNPIVVENYDTCSDMQLIGTTRLHQAEQEYKGLHLPLIVRQLESYSEKDKRKYVHFVDGGITDNLGLRAISDILAISNFDDSDLKINKHPPRYVVIITVDASTNLDNEMDSSNKEPSSLGVIGAVSKLQLTRYDEDSRLLTGSTVNAWAAKVSTPEHPVTPHFINVSLKDVSDPVALAFFDKIPTSFSLTDEQVDRLVAAGNELLKNNPAFQQLLADLAGQ